MQQLFIGAHIKKEANLMATIKKIQEAHGNALQIFVSNPMSAALPNMQAYEQISKEVKEYCSQTDFKLVIHASYTINLAKELKQNKRKMELKDCYWINSLIHELMVSDMLGATGVIVHVGKHTTNTKEEGMQHMYNAIKFIVQELKALHIKSKLIIETPAGQGTELLVNVHEFMEFYNSFTADEKKHLGICIDTAHIWSAGYDINEYYKIISKDNAKDIVAIHYNNSKKHQGSCVDAHDFLMDGKIPIDSLHDFVVTLKNNPIIILEKPSDDLQKEIHWIKSVIFLHD